MTKTKKNKAKSQLLSIAEYARRRHCSRQAILRACGAGKITRHALGKIDPIEADAALDAHQESYSEALRRKTLASARLAELELAQKKGEVVELDLVRRVQGEINSNIRSRLLQLPSKLAQRLSGVEDMAQIQVIVHSEVVETLTELSEARW